ncbi:serine/threonine-protein kinase [Streptomyces sp. NPDC002248]
MSNLSLPSQIGPYLVERRLGAGGMGEVFLAYSVAGEPVAVKVIRPDRTDPHTRARFEREAAIARTISGTGRVARFIDADPFAELPWLAMDYVPGRPLSEVIQERGPLPLPLVASLGALLAEGLAAVHAVDLVHRDLKAQNVILGDFGPVIIDFGLGAFVGASAGSLTQAGAVIGTVRCMPPEQADPDKEVTQAADVYGLGTVLLYAAAGHYPYDSDRWDAVFAQVTNATRGPDLAGLPEGLVPVVSAMLAYEAADRPSLPEVTGACVALMRGLGTSPVRARRDLIRETAPVDQHTMVLPQPDSPMLDRLDSLERRLREEADTPPAPPADASPSDSTSSGLTPTPVLPGVGAETPSPPQAGNHPTGPPRGGRPAASRRVAEELRQRYARGPALTWPKR